MGIFFACLNVDQKVQKVLQKFPVKRIGTLEPSTDPQMIVGRIVPANFVHSSPVSKTPCVWYEIIVEELVQTTKKGKTQTHWKFRYKEVRTSSFFLVDPESAPGVHVFVPGDTIPLKIHSLEVKVGTGLHGFFYKNDDAELHAMHLRHSFNEHGAMFGSRKLRYREKMFSVNEQVAVVGVVSDGMDFNNHPTKLIQPISPNTYSEDFFVRNKWSDWEKRSWVDLTADPSIMLTDNPRLMGSNTVPMTTYDPMAGLYGPVPYFSEVQEESVKVHMSRPASTPSNPTRTTQTSGQDVAQSESCDLDQEVPAMQ